MGPAVRAASLLEQREFEPPVSFALLLSESDREAPIEKAAQIDDKTKHSVG